MFLLNFRIHIQIRNKPKHVRMAPKELQNVEDFADLFIKADLIEFISMETNIHRILIRVITTRELKKWVALAIVMICPTILIDSLRCNP
ncbi:hypothetical protein V1477_008136 [Vespula maculifrons]|uniref:Uncharacterized protein n=1 Tax=Vespula maculifrons TaxID=7453 RepID=A0ABD2CC52_VESMC